MLREPDDNRSIHRSQVEVSAATRQPLRNMRATTRKRLPMHESSRNEVRTRPRCAGTLQHMTPHRHSNDRLGHT